MRVEDPTRDLWAYALTFLPSDLEDLGRRHGVERLRGFSSVGDLVRVILAWCQPGSSFRTTSAWARSSGIAKLSAESLFYRVSQSEGLLEAIMGRMLESWRGLKSSRRLMLVDATVLSGPASSGTNWRVHMLYDPCRAVPCGVQVTDWSEGETLSRHNLMPGDLVIADRGYGHFRGFLGALSKGADVLVRVEPCQMKLTGMDGKRVSLKALESQVPQTGSESFELVWNGPDRDCRKVRLVGTRTKTCQVCWLATNLDQDALASSQAAELYRVRWQIELLFKRLKGLLDLDELRSREGPSVKAFIYAKLITAFLALRLCDESGAFSPYGYDIGNSSPAQPLAGVQVRAGRGPSGHIGHRKVVSQGQMVGKPTGAAA